MTGSATAGGMRDAVSSGWSLTGSSAVALQPFSGVVLGRPAGGRPSLR
jgi:hypothetical protein